MTTANPLRGLHIPHVPHLITGAYGAMSECFKKPKKLAFPMPLFPKLPRGVSFGILKIWGDQVNIDLKNLGTGIFWALSVSTKPLISISHFWKFWPKLTTDVDRMGLAYSSFNEFRYLCRNIVLAIVIFIAPLYPGQCHCSLIWTFPINVPQRTEVF